MKNKTLGNKLFKSGKVLIAVAGVSVIMTNAVIPVISTVSADTNKVTPVHTASNWRANDQKTVDNNMRSQGINSINDLSNYNVVWGDTLTTIANHFHTTADELKNKFNIENADFIVAGFELSNQSQFNSIGRELLSSSITSLNKNTTAAYLQKPTNVYRRSNSNNSTSNTEQKQVVAAFRFCSGFQSTRPYRICPGEVGRTSQVKLSKGHQEGGDNKLHKRSTVTATHIELQVAVVLHMCACR